MLEGSLYIFLHRRGRSQIEGIMCGLGLASMPLSQDLGWAADGSFWPIQYLHPFASSHRGDSENR